MQSFYTALNSMDLLQVSGEDSGKFLQGQLTCDLDKLSEDCCQPGAACNNKGRVYSSFRLLHHKDGFFLSMQPGLLSTTQQSLNKYIPFYKAQMKDVSQQYKRIGLAGTEAEAVLKNIVQTLPEKNHSLNVQGALIINLSEHLPRYELWLDPQDSGAFNLIFDDIPGREIAAWELLDHQAGVLLIHAQESGLYTPEELNMDLAGFISFDKGCYTGQEIVARMHYRGKANKRLYRVSISASVAPSDMTLHDEQEKVVGDLFNLLPAEDKTWSAVAVLKTGAITDHRFFMDSAEGKIAAKVTPFTGSSGFEQEKN